MNTENHPFVSKDQLCQDQNHLQHRTQNEDVVVVNHPAISALLIAPKDRMLRYEEVAEAPFSHKARPTHVIAGGSIKRTNGPTQINS